jgi:glyoxylase-like metal-dependent hydrolase (beta-lactamase superfamily II)
MSIDSTAADTPASFTRLQVPGLFKWMVGDMEVTAVSDGHATFPLSIVPDADPQEAERLARAAFLPPGDLPMAINTYVIRHGTKTVLVDTGAGGGLGPRAGKQGDNLRAAGIDPASVDVLFLTHLHPDHILGMTTQDGTAAFPNAELVLHQRELAYWSDDANMSQGTEFETFLFQSARHAVEAYAGRTTLLERDEQAVSPGVVAKELPGHTPGHTGLLVASGDDQLLIWGDIIHLPHLQFEHPEWGVGFDVDAAQTVATRRWILDRVAADRMMVAGMHLDFPGFGYVGRARDGAYTFVPSPWRHAF